MRYLISCVLLAVVLGGCAVKKTTTNVIPKQYDLLYLGKINDIHISTSYGNDVKIIHVKLSNNRTLILRDVIVREVPLIFDTTTTYQIAGFKQYGEYRRVNIKEMKNESQNPR